MKYEGCNLKNIEMVGNIKHEYGENAILRKLWFKILVKGSIFHHILDNISGSILRINMYKVSLESYSRALLGRTCSISIALMFKRRYHCESAQKVL